MGYCVEKRSDDADLEPVKFFFDRTGPAGLAFSTGPDRPVEILDLTGKNRQKTGRFSYRIQPAKNQEDKIS